MTIEERLAWLHREATTLHTGDLVELKHNLKQMIEEAEQALDCVRVELEGQRSRTGWPGATPHGDRTAGR